MKTTTLRTLLMLTLAIGLALACAPALRQDSRMTPPATGAAATADPYLWLEEMTGEKALAWVKERNAESSKELAGTPAFQELETELRKIYDSTDRIPYISKEGPFYYNFWQDEKHPRGIWRRTTLDEYRKAEPKWDVILDIDALNKKEKETWVFAGAQLLRPDRRRCIVTLSRGGADATVNREFDMETRSFVKDGFQLPEAKGGMSWIDEDSVYVATDFGPGSMTTSGYPRIVKLWKRGSPLTAAATVFEGEATDMSVGAFYDDTKGFERHFVSRAIAFYKSELFLRGADGALQKIDIPVDANGSVHREWLLVQLRSAWDIGGQSHPAGALLAIRFDDFMKGKRDFTVLFKPTATMSLAYYSWTLGHLIVNALDDVKNRVWALAPAAGEWKRTEFPGAPEFATVSAWGVDERESDDVFMIITDFLTPTSLHLGAIGRGLERLKQTPAFFDASGLEIGQHFAKSKDGTRVPYFQVSKKGMTLDGKQPTLLTGYGGFEIPLVPYYDGAIGRAWLGQGGVFVVANIRGGGEYGPTWHQAALKANRHRAFEDFAAVAEDLIARGVTSPRHLGAVGGSNGGLLVGNMITTYPKLFGAIVCMVPLLDMQRYTHLSAGASWIAEYGDPEKPEEWAFMRNFSPYQNLRKGVSYPPVLFVTSTRDDRVHPGHARKMMARMLEMGSDVRYYENTEGGHAAAADNEQEAHMWALTYQFLRRKLT